ncbi:MAG: fibronectin type III domain-containing protein, partial [Lachnospiraceae bacterium]|nr:fibronectin type III domain-containing protein [Lachnospiraceae bacterium]
PLTKLYCGENNLKTLDLSSLPGSFDVTRASNWVGGTVEGTILTIAEGTDTVTYDYDCGRGLTAHLKLSTPVVRNVKETYKTTTTLKLCFDRVDGAARYGIYNVTTGKETSCSTQSGIYTLTKTVTGLKQGKRYVFIVYAYDADGNRIAQSAEYAKSTAVIDQVKNVKQVKSTSSTVKISFSKVENATSYKIFNDGGRVLATCTTQGGAKTLKKTITGLAADSTYKIRVRAYLNDGTVSEYGAYSDVLSVKTAKK